MSHDDTTLPSDAAPQEPVFAEPWQAQAFALAVQQIGRAHV